MTGQQLGADMAMGLHLFKFQIAEPAGFFQDIVVDADFADIMHGCREIEQGVDLLG